MTIHICGDSTAASYTPARAPMTGWGQVLGDYLPGIDIKNYAMPGRSTKSFIYEGRLQQVEDCLQQGDIVLIQFTHNDENTLVWRYAEPYTAFVNQLSIFVETARLHGAVPVLLTPLCMRIYSEDELQPTHGVYPDAIRLVAHQKQVPLIDVYRQGFEHLKTLGMEESKHIHIHLQPGVYDAYPDGAQDNAHTSREGADYYARMIAEGLRSLGLTGMGGV